MSKISKRVAVREIFLIALIILSAFLTLIALVILAGGEFESSTFLLSTMLTGAIGSFTLDRLKKNPKLANRISTLFAIVLGAFLISMLSALETVSHDATEVIFVILMIQLGTMIASSIAHGILGLRGRFIDSFIVIFGFGFCNFLGTLFGEGFTSATEVGVTLGILGAILLTQTLAENFSRISDKNDPWLAALSLLTLAKIFPLNYNPSRS